MREQSRPKGRKQRPVVHYGIHGDGSRGYTTTLDFTFEDPEQAPTLLAMKSLLPAGFKVEFLGEGRYRVSKPDADRTATGSAFDALARHFNWNTRHHEE